MNIRQKTLLQGLFQHKEYLSAEELSQYYAVSTKTIYKDVTQINYFLEAFSIQIDKKPRRGIRLSCDAETKNKILRSLGQLPSPAPCLSYSSETREIELFKRIAFTRERVEVLDFSLEYYVSTMSVRRDLEKIEELAHSFQVTITKSKKSLSLTGDEQHIRRFIREFIAQKLLLDEKRYDLQKLSFFFEGALLETIEQKITDLERSYHFTISDVYRPYLIIDLAVAIKRMTIQQTIRCEQPLLKNKIEEYEVSSFITDLLSPLLNVSPKDLSIYEIQYLTSCLFSVGYRPEAVIWPIEISSLIDDFIKEVGQFTHFDISKDEHLKQMLLNHIQPMIFRLKNGLSISNPITEIIKTQYSALYNLIWLASKVLSNYFELELNETEIAFLTIHFEIAIEKLVKPLTIYVICSYHLATSELIMSQLRKFIPDCNHLVVIKVSDLPDLTLSESDLLVSTIDLSAFNLPFLFVHSVLTPQEKAIIQSHCTNYTQGNHHLLAQLKNDELLNRTLIERLLGNTIYLKRSFKNKHECLKELISLSDQLNLQRNEFEQSVWDREKMGNTSTYTGVAMPHANPEYVEQSQLIMMTMDKPIQWGQHLVKVIMLIAIESEELPFYQNALVSIYSKIDSPSYIEQLARSKDLADFKTNLFKDALYV